MMTPDEWREHWGPRTRQLPSGRALAECGWVLAGIGMHRDSGPLAESNFSVATRSLLSVAGTDENFGDLGDPYWWEDPDSLDIPPVMIAHFRHWAVGWVDELVVRADRDDVIAECARIADALDSYAVLDDMDYSEREWAANHPDGSDECYSEDPDCPCDRSEREL